ncbi:hypothetical protein [Nannocystis sp.]|uniref:hypothetical protein n=1 Tax=Nannocystis sp. TaxID=1962667 RepID=UPI00242749D1|nr:hypothetical protein [Nannocystis sp.]MBK7824341.1 hypothetical protein [Nannocystis sp.]MBK9754518.1 hypothetical protein [Nannocystis sp.]
MLRTSLLCCVASLCTELASTAHAAAQVPPTRPSSQSSLPPMSPARPVDGRPPDVGVSTSSVDPGPAPVVIPVVVPTTTEPSQSPTPPAAVGARASDPAAPEARPGEPIRSPSDRYGVAAPQPRRAWGEGSTLLTRDAKVGVYIAPTFKLTGINRLPSLMLGADFAVLIAERFAIGAAGSALVTPLPALRNDGRTFNLRTQYAGVTLGVALVRVKFFSLGVGALVGGGRVCLNDERLDRCVNRAAMFVAEPELGFSFALTRVLRLVISGGYRFAVVQAWSGPSDRLLGGFTGTLAFRLGKF